MTRRPSRIASAADAASGAAASRRSTARGRSRLHRHPHPGQRRVDVVPATRPVPGQVAHVITIPLTAPDPPRPRPRTIGPLNTAPGEGEGVERLTTGGTAQPGLDDRHVVARGGEAAGDHAPGGAGADDDPAHAPRRPSEPGQVGGVVVARQAPAAGATSSSSVSEAFVVNSSKPPVEGVRRAIRSTALTTPPWQQTTIVAPGVGVHGVAHGLADAVVQLGDRLAAGERDGVRVRLPVRHAVALDELVERQPVAVGAGVVLAPAVVAEDRRPPSAPAIRSAVSRARG